MGYDHFALLVVPENLYDNNRLELVEQICQQLRDQDDDMLFGEVHHLSAGGFNDYWWQRFDHFVEQFYLKSLIHKVYIYVCEFDGESLSRYEYIDGKRSDDVYDVKMNINDVSVKTYWNMKSLEIKGNITIFYNPDYDYEYYY